MLGFFATHRFLKLPGEGAAQVQNSGIGAFRLKPEHDSSSELVISLAANLRNLEHVDRIPAPADFLRSIAGLIKRYFVL